MPKTEVCSNGDFERAAQPLVSRTEPFQSAFRALFDRRCDRDPEPQTRNSSLGFFALLRSRSTSRLRSARRWRWRWRWRWCVGSSRRCAAPRRIVRRLVSAARCISSPTPRRLRTPQRCGRPDRSRRRRSRRCRRGSDSQGRPAAVPRRRLRIPRQNEREEPERCCRAPTRRG